MMNPNTSHPTAEELAELAANTWRPAGGHPAPGEPGFPSGLAGELLKLAEKHPSLTPPLLPGWSCSSARQPRQVHKLPVPVGCLRCGNPFTHPRKENHHETPSSICPHRHHPIRHCVGLHSRHSSPRPPKHSWSWRPQPTSTPVPTPFSPLTPTVVPPTSQSRWRSTSLLSPSRTSRPLLPSLADALGVRLWRDSGAGNLPQGLPVSLATELPQAPSEVTAYYRLENTPLTLEEASRLQPSGD